MKENTKLEIYKPKKGLIPVIKSYLFGDEYMNNSEGIIQQTFFQILGGGWIFGRKDLKYLVNSGSQNPIVSGVIQKILFAQSNIKFIPYKSGKPYKSATFALDINFATQMLCYTGTIFIYKAPIIGFGYELQVLNTLFVTENFSKNTFNYQVTPTVSITIPKSELIIIKFKDIVNENNTHFGLSPLQIALMPMEALEQMYLADTSTLKNKGVDGMITNDSDMPLVNNEQETFDEVINNRIGGARRSGGVATSQAKLRFIQFGRSTKELALWDGYKIKLRDICNVFQVDSGQFNDPDNKKFANVSESNKALYNDCVIPLTKLVTENKELQKELGYQIYLDISDIDCLQEAQSLKMEKNKSIMEAIFNLNQKVKDGVISYEIAIKILVSEFGFDELEAKDMIVLRNQDTNKQADSLNTLSPIVATKVMESTTTNERRMLIGLDTIADGDIIPINKPTF